MVHQRFNIALPWSLKGRLKKERSTRYHPPLVWVSARSVRLLTFSFNTLVAHLITTGRQKKTWWGQRDWCEQKVTKRKFYYRNRRTEIKYISERKRTPERLSLLQRSLLEGYVAVDIIRAIFRSVKLWSYCTNTHWGTDTVDCFQVLLSLKVDIE